jgi:hypothetical protein
MFIRIVDSYASNVESVAKDSQLLLEAPLLDVALRICKRHMLNQDTVGGSFSFHTLRTQRMNALQWRK